MMAPLAPPVFASPGLGPPQMDGDRDREEHRREHRHRQPANYDTELSRRLSKFLRHPDHAIRDERLKVGDDGWAELPAVLERLNLKINGEPVPSPVDREMVMVVVEHSKNREVRRFEHKSEAGQEFVRAKYKVSLHQRRTTGEPRATAATSASTTPPAPTTPPPPPTAAHDDDADASQEAASQEDTIAELKSRVAEVETSNALLHGQLDKVLLERDEKLAQRDAKIAQLEERIAQLEGRSDGAAPVPSAAPVAPAPGAVDVGAVPDSSKDMWL